MTDDIYVTPDVVPRENEVPLIRQLARRLEQVGPLVGTVTFAVDGSISDGSTVTTFPADGSIVVTAADGTVYTTTFIDGSIVTT